MAQRLFLLVLCLMLVGCEKQTTLMEQAESLENEGRFEEAVTVYQQIISENIQHENAEGKMTALNATLGLYGCHMKMSQHAEAVDAMTNAIQLAVVINDDVPDYTSILKMATLHELRALAHKLSNNIEAAQDDYLRSRQLQQIHEQQMQEIGRQEVSIRKNPVSLKSSGGSE